ncbi:MAG: flippase [Oscillospiraceae bacterium]|nr:flippase [Oscillospiraceae bacterium]
MASLRKNFLYQTGYQIIATALPLITSPYISRVLGAEQLGTYSYVSTIANYFSVVAAAGIVSYGTREVAKRKNEQKTASEFYSELRKLQLLLSGIVSIVYIAFVLLFVDEYKFVYFTQLLLIINSGFDISWLFNGEEEFKSVVIKNLVVKLISLVGIFTLVHSPSDMPIYALLIAGSVLFGNLTLFRSKRKYVVKADVSLKQSLTHLAPSMLLFVPSIGMTLYHQMDKTMLGLMSTYTQVGYYYNADKIVNILIGVISGFGTVSLPRITTLLAEQKMDEYENLVEKSFHIIMFSCSAIAFGITAVSSEFTPWFFGEEYLPSVQLVSALSMVIFFKSWSTISRNDYLIPQNKNSVYISSVFLGVIVNVIVNYIMIKRYDAMGAVIGTLVAEAFVSIYQFIIMNREVHVFRMLARTAMYPAFGMVMLIVVRVIANILNYGYFADLIIEVTVGAIAYLTLCFAYWKIRKDKFIFPIVNDYLRKIFRRKDS